MTHLPPSPFITDPDNRFVLDEAAFMAAIEPAPAFLAAPRQEYLRAVEIMPIVETIVPFIARPSAPPDALLMIDVPGCLVASTPSRAAAGA